MCYLLHCHHASCSWEPFCHCTFQAVMLHLLQNHTPLIPKLKIRQNWQGLLVLWNAVTICCLQRQGAEEKLVRKVQMGDRQPGVFYRQPWQGKKNDMVICCGKLGVQLRQPFDPMDPYWVRVLVQTSITILWKTLDTTCVTKGPVVYLAFGLS